MSDHVSLRKRVGDREYNWLDGHMYKCIHSYFISLHNSNESE